MNKTLLYNRLYTWYEINRRTLPWRETTDGYHIWLSEIILQQTRVAQGLEYYLRFVAHWPDITSLASAREEEVLREWQGLGYYSRARNLHKAAQTVVAQGWTPFPALFEDIRSLPGIGDYTAGAIASFAYNQPYPAMDGNVYRVVARLFDIDTPFDTSAGKRLFHKQLEQILDREQPRLFNSAIMEFGALQCVPQLGDNCLVCPLQSVCRAYTNGTAALLPVRKPRPQLRDRWLTYHIYLQEEQTEGRGNTLYTLIRQRTQKDIWMHLYEFPCDEMPDTPQHKWPDSTTASPEGQTGFELTHVLSHQRLHARFITHKVETLPKIPDTLRINLHDLDRYALSRLTLRALEHLGLS